MKSIWNNQEKLKFSDLSENIETDVCIIGGGITGISTAYNLIQSKKNVVVLEKNCISAMHKDNCMPKT